MDPAKAERDEQFMEMLKDRVRDLALLFQSLDNYKDCIMDVMITRTSIMVNVFDCTKPDLPDLIRQYYDMP